MTITLRRLGTMVNSGWVLGPALGLAAAKLATALNLVQGQGAHLGMFVAAILFSGAVLGLWPIRPWRWGIAPWILLPVLDADPRDVVGSLSLALVALPLTILVFAPPALLGAYVAALARRGAPSITLSQLSFWTSAVLLALLTGSLPLLLVRSDGMPLAAAAGAAFLAAFGICRARPRHTWALGTIVALGFPLVVFGRIVVDGLRDPTSHNLAPFEILYALLASVPAALGGAFLAATLRGPRGPTTDGPSDGA